MAAGTARSRPASTFCRFPEGESAESIGGVGRHRGSAGMADAPRAALHTGLGHPREGRLMNPLLRVAWILILVVDLGYLAWGVMAAVFLDRLLGPHGIPILPAGYSGFTGASWSELVKSAPGTAAYMELLFRT